MTGRHWLIIVLVLVLVLVTAARRGRSIVPVTLHVYRLILVLAQVHRPIGRMLSGPVTMLLQMTQDGKVLSALLDALLDVLRNLLGCPLQPAVTHGTRMALT